MGGIRGSDIVSGAADSAKDECSAWDERSWGSV